MSRRSVRAALGLLALSVAGFSSAWLFQAQAAADLDRSRRLSETEVEGGGSSPQSIDDYEAVLGSLNESIEIRAEIDGQLGEIERIVRELRSQGTLAEETAGAARSQLQEIATTLGGALEAARAAFGDLEGLSDTLGNSARLARAIADELEEMDRELGPTAP